jgi:cobyrinic acid a,c-diamide synthase
MRDESAAALSEMPRLVIAGLSGESGKTLISLALLLEARRRDLPARAFKKGPDYIDASWLEWASRNPARNLDTFLMGFERAAASFAWHGVPAGLNLIEGNRGLFDGLDARGTHSTAELAKTLQAPVVLVVNATKITRTAAALVLGCQKLDPALWIAGVVINQAAGSRHARVVREAIESACRIPVLGIVPRAPSDAFLPMRHLGLVTPHEYAERDLLERNLLSLVAPHLEFDRLLKIAREAPPLPAPAMTGGGPMEGAGLTVGYLRDGAFCFYYPENLEALRASGATLVPVSALSAEELPAALDALYIGGGFPETHARKLSANTSFLASVRRRAVEGLPVYAECGGLMFLSRAVTWQGSRYPMAAVLPFEVEVDAAPQGHGYIELEVDRSNPFFAVGTRLRGHEFHYSRIVPEADPPPTACAVLRGTGCYPGRDAVSLHNVWASYTHLHALATPEWARGFLQAVRVMVG